MYIDQIPESLCMHYAPTSIKIVLMNMHVYVHVLFIYLYPWQYCLYDYEIIVCTIVNGLSE